MTIYETIRADLEHELTVFRRNRLTARDCAECIGRNPYSSTVLAYVTRAMRGMPGWSTHRYPNGRVVYLRGDTKPIPYYLPDHAGAERLAYVREADRKFNELRVKVIDEMARAALRTDLIGSHELAHRVGFPHPTKRLIASINHIVRQDCPRWVDCHMLQGRRGWRLGP